MQTFLHPCLSCYLRPALQNYVTANNIQIIIINEPFKSYFDYFCTPEQAADPFVIDSFTFLLIYLQLIKLN